LIETNKRNKKESKKNPLKIPFENPFFLRRKKENQQRE